jgi:hypothetical protein
MLEGLARVVNDLQLLVVDTGRQQIFRSVFEGRSVALRSFVDGMLVTASSATSR